MYEEEPNTIRSTTDLFGNYRLAERFKPNGKRATSERAELIRYFSLKMEWPPARTGYFLSHITDLRDLYALRSDCDAAEREGRCAWGAAFRTALGLTKKHEKII